MYQVEDRWCTHDVRCRHPLKNPTLSKVVNKNFYGMKERFMKSSASNNYIIMGKRQNPWFQLQDHLNCQLPEANGFLQEDVQCPD